MRAPRRANHSRGFTHVDPFEDTESGRLHPAPHPPHPVSPTSIRSRILKDFFRNNGRALLHGFTHVDPFEDTESPSQRAQTPQQRRFTHVDPFEDTESRAAFR